MPAIGRSYPPGQNGNVPDLQSEWTMHDGATSTLSARHWVLQFTPILDQFEWEAISPLLEACWSSQHGDWVYQDCVDVLSRCYPDFTPIMSEIRSSRHEIHLWDYRDRYI